MTELFFYTDPLKAAWMDREFGVKLICYPTEEQAIVYESTNPWEWMFSCWEGGGPDVETVEDALLFLEEATDKIYIHPDSHHIFLPQVGDFVEYGIRYDNGELSEFYYNDWVKELEEDGNNEVTEIIKRNGKHFFMPEREEK